MRRSGPTPRGVADRHERERRKIIARKWQRTLQRQPGTVTASEEEQFRELLRARWPDPVPVPAGDGEEGR